MKIDFIITISLLCTSGWPDLYPWLSPYWRLAGRVSRPQERTRWMCCGMSDAPDLQNSFYGG